MSTNDFQSLVNQIKGGSTEAVSLLVEEYGDAVCMVIRRRLHRLMRSQYDTADFAQIVWASFFSGLDKLSTFQTARDFERYLVRIAENKVTDACRKRMILQKNNVNRERSLDRESTRVDIPSDDPSASHVVDVREQWQRLMQSLPPRYRQIISLRAGGATIQEIADTVNIHERTVRRILKELARVETE